MLSWPISLIMRFLGTGRYIYNFAVANLYVLPAPGGHAGPGAAGAPRRRPAGLRYPHAALHRSHRLCGCGCGRAGIWAFVLYTDERRPQGARGILTGALLTLVFLLRRYFFFFTVSFGLAALLALAVRRSQWKSFVALCASGAVCSLFFGQSLPGVAGAGGQLLRHLLRL